MVSNVNPIEFITEKNARPKKTSHFLFPNDRKNKNSRSLYINVQHIKIKMMNKSFINTDFLLEKMKEWAIRIGRISTRPALLLYFVMMSKDTAKSDKLLILSTLSYLVLPIDLISAKRLPIIGWMDEAVSLTVTYQKVSKYITPSIERKVDEILDKWFPTYTTYIEVID